MSGDCHRESLLRIPLVRQMLEDPSVALVSRAVDEAWTRRGLSRTNVVGFNPIHGTVYYARRSAFASWLEAPRRSARRLNDEDVLVDAVLFAAHDYLHAWAFLAIRKLAPELGFGERPITPDNVEDFVFCLLATEAAAVVGLDYWYLSTVELNDVCPIGTATRGVAVRYRESDLPEYRRFNRGLQVQTEEFFSTLARFYMDGEFPGFDLDDAMASPLLMRWVSQEVLYGDRQRIYMRQWCRYLSADAIAYAPSSLSSPVASDAPWQRQLLADLGSMLWAKVKRDVLHTLDPAPDPSTLWRIPTGKDVDFRFVNANRFHDVDVNSLDSLRDSLENFNVYMDQFVSRHVFDHDTTWPEILAHVRQSRSTTLLHHVLRGCELVEGPKQEEPMSLFFQA